MQRPLIAIALVWLVAVSASAASLGELFQKAKGEFSGGRYQDALKTLDALKVESQKPENEKYRSQLAPAMAFYRGATLAALGKEVEARTELETYLEIQPNATLDSSAYPKKVVVAFDQTKKGRQKAGSGADAGFAAAYRDFRPEAAAMPSDERWADGPVRYLMTSAEKTAWSGISGPAERARFIEEFWRSRDSRPETPTNEFRQEFERRVAFADSRFAQGEKRGADTDRGMVFILLGPPTYAGRKPLGTGEDTSDAGGLSTAGRHDAEVAIRSAGKVSSGQQAQLADRSSGTSLRDAANYWREVWHYRRELLPPGVPYQQVDVEFVTKKGYGENVMQRDSPTLTTIEAAKKVTSARS
jgi:GWxTD domain-containing protein